MQNNKKATKVSNSAEVQNNVLNIGDVYANFAEVYAKFAEVHNNVLNFANFDRIATIAIARKYESISQKNVGSQNKA